MTPRRPRPTSHFSVPPVRRWSLSPLSLTDLSQEQTWWTTRPQQTEEKSLDVPPPQDQALQPREPQPQSHQAQSRQAQEPQDQARQAQAHQTP